MSLRMCLSVIEPLGGRMKRHPALAVALLACSDFPPLLGACGCCRVRAGCVSGPLLGFPSSWNPRPLRSCAPRHTIIAACPWRAPEHRLQCIRP